MAVVFYFSGTGNSLDVAKQAAAVFSDCRLESMARYIAQPYCIQDDVIGFVCPVYCFDLPPLVQKFIAVLQAKPEYCFGLVTMGGDQGRALKHMQLLLGQKEIQLDYADAIIMPDNFFVTPPAKARTMLIEADQKLQSILTYLHDHRQDTTQCMEKTLWKYGGVALCWWYMRNILNIEKLELDVNKCISCGQCVKVCPVGNITMQDGKPVPGNQCATCFACVRWCPKHALKLGGKGASDKKNYVNPNINIQELFSQEAK